MRNDSLPLRKIEYPPLLPLGIHPFTLRQVRKMCVTPFGSRERLELFLNLQSLCRRFRQDRVRGQLWIDGSFVTAKPYPNDVDLLLIVQEADYVKEQGNVQYKQTVNWFVGQAKQELRCDGHLLPVADPLLSAERVTATQEQFLYWYNLFSRGRTGEIKGIIQVGINS